MSIDAPPSHGAKVRKDLNVYRRSRHRERRSVRTLMSIDAQPSQGEKVHKDLMSIDLAAKQNPAAGDRPPRDGSDRNSS